jgi:hypothetical protein
MEDSFLPNVRRNQKHMSKENFDGKFGTEDSRNLAPTVYFHGRNDPTNVIKQRKIGGK